MPSQKRRRLEWQMRVRAPLEEVQRRPPRQQLDAEKDDLIVQIVDLHGVPNSGDLILTGSTQRGNSVTARILGFTPYFYALPNESGPFGSSDQMEALHALLNAATGVINIEIVSKVITGVTEKACMLFKLTFEGSESLCVVQNTLLGARYNVYEANVDFATRFLVDHELPGLGGWVRFPAGKYKIVADSDAKSHSQVEILISHNAVTNCDDDYPTAPLRVLSFDFETLFNLKARNSKPLTDPIIQISNMVSRPGDANPFLRVIFTLDSCDPIDVDVYVCSYDTEREMLLAWQNFILAVDPDVLTGYNIMHFDLSYIIDRVRLTMPDFDLNLGRWKESSMNWSEPYFYEELFRAKGFYKNGRPGKYVEVEGRVVLDLYRHFTRNHTRFQLDSYSLKNVAQNFLSDDPDSQKLDVEYTDIPKLQNEGSASRRHLAIYCLQDAKVPLQLLNRLHILEDYLRKGKEKQVPFANLLAPTPWLEDLGVQLAKARSAEKRDASPPPSGPIPSSKRQKLEHEVKSRPALKEMLKRPASPELDLETDDLVIQIVDVHEIPDSAHLIIIITGSTEASSLWIIQHNEVEACEGRGNAPLRVLFFDIECIFRTWSFEWESLNPFCVSFSRLSRVIRSKTSTFIHTDLRVSCSVGLHHDVGLDVLTGFNILNFDLWFIIERAQKLAIFNVELSRSKGSLTKHANYFFHSDKYGFRQGKMSRYQAESSWTYFDISLESLYI
ncbi:ribonuclease H-like domain-containing protein [Desarmillaria ectypa]|nr:ribonuclease H-like domain-containing protein [Desarmillaria ectypa]